MIIYKATNMINGKIYIGQTVRPLKERIHNHYKSDHGYFPKALRKYGLDNFQFTILETLDSREMLDIREVYWINYCGCKWPNGYNLTNGGEGNSGYVVSEETRAKKLAGFTAEVRAKIAEAGRGRKLSPATRKILSDTAKIRCQEKGPPPSQKGRKRTEETKNKLKGKKHALGSIRSEETKIKISAALKGNKNALGYKASVESNMKKSIAMKGKTLSLEHRQKLSEAAKRRMMFYPMPWQIDKHKQETVNHVIQGGNKS